MLRHPCRSTVGVTALTVRAGSGPDVISVALREPPLTKDGCNSPAHVASDGVHGDEQ